MNKYITLFKSGKFGFTFIQIEVKKINFNKYTLNALRRFLKNI